MRLRDLVELARELENRAAGVREGVEALAAGRARDASLRQEVAQLERLYSMFRRAWEELQDQVPEDVAVEP